MYLGVIDIVWQGKRLDIEKGAKVKLGGMKNVAVTLSRSLGRAQEFEGSEVTATFALARGQKLKDIFATAEGELQAQCDTGQTYVWPDAFLTNRPEMTGGEGGKIELKWMGGEPQELLNG